MVTELTSSSKTIWTDTSGGHLGRRFFYGIYGNFCCKAEVDGLPGNGELRALSSHSF